LLNGQLFTRRLIAIEFLPIRFESFASVSGGYQVQQESFNAQQLIEHCFCVHLVIFYCFRLKLVRQR
jgi:hypothetical protein